MDYPQTKFFQACRGVFEGGGCRGAAHIGAFNTAIRCGINFSEVAGTSAGSIIAALVGAGATPEFLLEKCAYLKFSDLLAAPQGRISPGWIARTVGPFVRGKMRLFGKILSNGSAYSSKELEAWLDGLLAELLPATKRPIKFKDLILPTWVVATDLGGRRPKIWSTKDTPDEMVAMAVRSSCSIPLFFEPVESGNNLYVDGGMLSNLPSFVFADRQDSAALGGRILAFRLVENRSSGLERNLGALASRLIDTSISGATDIQHAMQSNVSIVPVATGDVSSLNFDISKGEVETLLESGRSAMVDFIRDEHARLNDSVASDIVRHGEDELFDDLVRELAIPGRRLIVACTKTRWFWDLFPSVVHWMFAGASIDVVMPRGAVSAREKQRREMLRRLGARIVEVDAPPLSCFLLSRRDDNHNALFIQGISESQFSPTGSVYIGLKHRPVIVTFLDMLDRLLPMDNSPKPTLSLRQEAPDRIVALLKTGVNQYSTPEVKIELKEIALQSPQQPIHMIVRRVRSFKFRQIAYLDALYKRYDIPLFAPAGIYAGDEFVSTIVPPVLEEWSGKRVAIEGNTRVLYLSRGGSKSMHALVASGVAAPLPGVPVEPREALLSTYELPVEERIKGLKQENFRSVEGAARPAG
jgi:predicted acylesterase/phospholipase RssA